MGKDYEFSIEQNDSEDEVACQICGVVFNPGIPLAVCADGVPICDDCAENYVPELFEAAELYFEEHEQD